MEKQLKTEIRAILSARTSTDADGWTVAVEGHLPLTMYGVADSSAIYGITSKSQTFSIAADAKNALQKLSKVFMRYGTMTVLQNDLEALACLRRKTFAKTVLVTAKNMGEGKILLTAHTGRSIMAKFTCKRTLKTLAKDLNKA